MFFIESPVNVVYISQGNFSATTTRQIVPSEPNKPTIPRGSRVTVNGPARLTTLPHGGNAYVYDIEYMGYYYVVFSQDITF